MNETTTKGVGADGASLASGDQARNVYCARVPGMPGFVSIMIDDQDDKAHKKLVADGLAEWVRAGYEVAGKFTRAEAITGFNEYAAEQKGRAAVAPPSPGTREERTLAIACRGSGAERRARDRADYERAMRGEA